MTKFINSTSIQKIDLNMAMEEAKLDVTPQKIKNSKFSSISFEDF